MSENHPIIIGGKPVKDMTANEIAAVTFRNPCGYCGGPPAIRIRVLVPLQELTERSPELVAAIAASNPDGPTVPTVPTKYGQMVKLRDYCACRQCQIDAEVEAAQYPSWYIVEIARAKGERPAWEKVSNLSL